MYLLFREDREVKQPLPKEVNLNVRGIATICQR